jgi:hypothetical protein
MTTNRAWLTAIVEGLLHRTPSCPRSGLHSAHQPVQPTAGEPTPMVNGDRIRALRYAREVVSDLRWRGMTVPPIYTTMAEEFHALVRSGAYAAWVTAAQKATR